MRKMTGNRRQYMKIRASSLALILSFMTAGIPAQAVEQALPPPAPVSVVTNSIGPKIQFAEPKYDFGRVRAGELVKHDFVFTNAGDALLEVTSVAPGCHCTTVGDWSRRVEPGKTGIIPIQFDSTIYNGQVDRSVSVISTDTKQPMAMVVLQITGTVFRPVDVSPPFAVLNITPDSSGDAAAVVHITNNEEQPLTLSDPQINNRAFAAELKASRPGRDFELVIKTVPPLGAQTVQGVITLKTSSSNMPVVNITAIAVIQPVVLTTPAQLTLPAAPLQSNQVHVVTIRNNGTNVLALFEPSVNANGVDVQLKESEPGRIFTVTLNFPAGFEIAAGEAVTLSVKSNHPRLPIIKVPIAQTPRPPAAPPPPPPAVSAPIQIQTTPPPPPAGKQDST